MIYLLNKRNFSKMHKRSVQAKGTLQRRTLKSKALEGNFLKDPETRDILIYLPPHYSADKHYSLLVDLAGYTSSGLAHTAWKGFGENLPERLDRLIAEGMEPCIVAMPDCFTRLGGNQYVNTPVFGNYETFLNEELLPSIEAEFYCGGPGHRGLFGKSSGGYGALYLSMKYPEVWSAAASHSGDMAFELVYGSDFTKALTYLNSKYEGSVALFMERFEVTYKQSGTDIHLLMLLAMAASYDPDVTQPYGVRLPFDLYTAEMIEDRWRAWLRFDPLRMIEKPVFQKALKLLKYLFIDCGTLDQYHIQYGARRFIRILEREKIPHVYEEFKDNHSGLDYRLDRSLPHMAKALVSK